MKTKAIEHVVITLLGTAAPAPIFSCERCGQHMLVQNNQALHLLQKHAAAFTLMHEDCKVPSPQLPLPKHTVQELESIGAPYDVSKKWPLCPATSWVDLWKDLEEALAPHELVALKAWTPLPEALRRSEAFAEVADWAWRDKTGGALQERPFLLRDCVYHAVKAHQEANPAPAKEPKQHAHKRPVLHLHYSNDTMPAKPRAHTAHSIVCTADQADAIRGALCSSVQFHSGDWDPTLLAYLECILPALNVSVNTSKLTLEQRAYLGAQDQANAEG
jgi:hypothetical protein